MAREEDEKKERQEAAEDRKAVIDRLTEIANSDKENYKDRLKARRQRDTMIKGEKSLKEDLKKNAKDLKDQFLGGIDGVLNESFGPLGGFMSSLTTGFFKRAETDKDALSLQQTQNEQGKDVIESIKGVEESTEETSKETKKAGGEQTKTTEDVVAALGGVADVSQTGYEDVELGLWTKMEDHLLFMRENIETAEDRRERLRKGAGGMVASKGKGGKEEEDGGGFSFLELMGLGNLAKKAKIFIVGLRKMLGTGLFGKGGLFRNLKAFFIRTMRSAFGPGALKALGATLKIGSRLAGIAGVILMPIIDGILGFFNAEDWGVSKVSGVLGGVLAGGEGGILNMFMNAGKWAAIGATIGSVVPIVGTIAGGIIGAVLGGILGLIGGDVVAASFDKVGAWFVSVFDTVVDAISKVWHAVMPEWFTSIDFAWTDIFPTGLVKLFNGEYFTVDVPSFSWYSLFPNFLVEWFKGTAEKISEKGFVWTDLLPQAIVDFFTGAIAKPDYKFSWEDLVPTFIVNVIKSVGEAFKDTPFTWKSLLPDFIVNLIDGVKIKEGSFEWRDLLPGFITKIFDAGKEAGTTETGEFDWTRLLPGWMTSAWDSTKAMAESAFNWASLLPGWLSAAWGDAKATGKSMAEGTFDWKNLLPEWLHGAFDSSVAIKGFASEGLDSLWVMIKEIFQGLVDKVLGLLPLETVETVKEIIEDPVGMAKKGLDAAGGAISDTASDVYEGGKNLLSSGLSLFGFGDDTEGKARGGIVVNRPTYLPSSGTIVGEHGTWSGKGAARGGVPMDGGPEAIIPLTGNRAQGFIAPIAASIAGAVMNQMAMDRVGLGGPGADPEIGQGVYDNSTQNIVTNNTIINSPEPQGPMLPGAGRDTAVSHFRHAA